MGNTRDTGYLRNLVSYDASGNIALPGNLNVAGIISGSVAGVVPTGRTLTINGTTYDLSADRSWTIPAGVTSFNTRTGAITLVSTDVTSALGFSPANGANYLALTGGTLTGAVSGTQFNASSKFTWGTNTTGSTGQIVTDNTNNFFDFIGTLNFRGAGSSIVRASINSGGTAVFAGSVTGAAFIPTVSTVPTIGMYSPSESRIGFSTNSTLHVSLTNNGNLLIGKTNDEGWKLDVNGIAKISGVASFGSSISATSATFTGALTVQSPTNVNAYIVSTGGDYNTNLYLGYGSVQTQTYIKRLAGNLVFGTTNGDRLTIGYNGNIGIGIDPQGAGSAKTLEIGSRGIIYDNNDNFLYGNNGWVDSGTWRYKQTGFANIIATNGGTFTFSTAPSGVQNNPITWSDRLRLTNGGNLLLGGVGNDAQVWMNSGLKIEGSRPGIDLVNNGGGTLNTIRWYGGVAGKELHMNFDTSTAIWALRFNSYYLSGGAASHEFYGNGNMIIAGVLTENSSIRYKKDVLDFALDTENIFKLRPVSYTKIDSGEKEIGLIAEEVEKLIPQMVRYDESGRVDGVNYTRLGVVLLAGFKYLKEELDKIKSNG